MRLLEFFGLVEETYEVEVKSGVAYDANTEPITYVTGNNEEQVVQNFNQQTGNNSSLRDLIIRDTEAKINKSRNSQ